MTERSPDGFQVRASEGAEGYVLVARGCKAQGHRGARFETVEIPKEPALPDVPASVYEPSPSLPDFSRMVGSAAAGERNHGNTIRNLLSRNPNSGSPAEAAGVDAIACRRRCHDGYAVRAHRSRAVVSAPPASVWSRCARRCRGRDGNGRFPC